MHATAANLIQWPVESTYKVIINISSQACIHNMFMYLASGDHEMKTKLTRLPLLTSYKYRACAHLDYLFKARRLLNNYWVN